MIKRSWLHVFSALFVFVALLGNRVRAGDPTLADLVRAGGEAHHYHAQASLTAEDAVGRKFDNMVKRVETFFLLRRMNAEYRAAERGPATSREALERYNRQRTPERLASHEVTLTNGEFRWPFALRESEFTGLRMRIESLFAERDPENSGLGSDNHHEIKRASNEMREMLKHLIDRFDTYEYLTAVRYVRGLGYEARFPVSSEGVASR